MYTDIQGSPKELAHLPGQIKICLGKQILPTNATNNLKSDCPVGK